MVSQLTHSKQTYYDIRYKMMHYCHFTLPPLDLKTATKDRYGPKKGKDSADSTTWNCGCLKQTTSCSLSAFHFPSVVRKRCVCLRLVVNMQELGGMTSVII